MKLISILVLFIFISCQCFSQSLEGEWKGSYDIDLDVPVSLTRPIKLYFVLNKDSSYKVYSYSKGKDLDRRDTIIVCKVLYNRISEDSLYLEEIEVLKPTNPGESCHQKMYLKIKRKDKSLLLEGTWQSVKKECSSSGQIRFTKKG
jgi:hypothetical protein